jgi:8-hydroxy-5-deazaflavin:NADPH oxidoreductase
MKVGILGGTGAVGSALAARLSGKHEVMMGSREKTKALAAASKIPGVKGDVSSVVARWCEVAVVALPFGGIRAVGSLAKALTGKLVVSMVNPLELEEGIFRYSSEGVSAAEAIAALLPGSRVATAFNNVPVSFFRKSAKEEVDVLIAADSRGTFELAASLVREIPGMRPMYVGPLNQAESVERLTVLVLNAARLNSGPRYSVRLVS